MSDPTLSILIPSYNGTQHLGKLLLSIEQQLRKNSGARIEIVLAINGSTDDSYEVALKFVDRIAPLRIFQFNDNLGYDKNILRLVSKAKGEYIWFIGDDDLILNRSLELVLRILENNQLNQQVKCMILEPIYFSDDFETKEVINEIEEINYFKDIESFVFRIRWNGAALSSLLLRKPSDEVLRNSEDLIGTNWIHLGLMYHEIRSDHEGLYCFVTKGVIAIRTGNPRWELNYGNFLYVGLVHLELLWNLLGRKNQRSRNMFRELRKEGNWEDVNRGILSLSKKEKKKVIYLEVKFMWKYPSFWLLTFPILLAPARFQAKFVAIEEKIYLTFRNLKNSISENIQERLSR